MFFNLHRVNINYLKHLFQGVGAGGKRAYTPLPIAWKGGEGGRTMILLISLFWKTVRKN
jgi:hypothetical protein